MASKIETVRAAVKVKRGPAVAETVDASGRVISGRVRDLYVAPCFPNVWTDGGHIGAKDKPHREELAECVASLRQLGFRVRDAGMYQFKVT